MYDELPMIGPLQSVVVVKCIQVVQEVSHNYKYLSDRQRKFVAVNTNDIFLRFIYEIGMIFDDDTRMFLL